MYRWKNKYWGHTKSILIKLKFLIKSYQISELFHCHFQSFHSAFGDIQQIYSNPVST